MPILSSRQSGNFTDASTWAVVDAASYLTTETTSQAVGNTFTASASFTPAAGTYEGLAVRVVQTATVPIGTFSARLQIAGVPIAGTTVTINVSDMSSSTNGMVGWVYLKFAAPVVLLAVATNVALVCSTANQVNCFTAISANNWNRMLVTTTTAAPINNDTLNIVGEYTGPAAGNDIEVIMNNTAIVDFTTINIGGRGTLTFGTAPSTNYVLRITGDMFVTGMGRLNIGTLANPMPESSSAVLRFLNVANVDFGLQIRGTAAVTTYGAAKIGRAYLNANAAAAATTITTDVSTGWLSGDQIALASTTTTATQTEERTLSANAVGTTVSIAALGFAHSGVTPTQAELINLSRNVRINGTSTTLQTFVTNVQGAFATVSFNFTEFRFLGSNVANRRGVSIDTTGIGSYVINGCSFRNFEVASSLGVLFGSSVTNTTITDCVFYRINNSAVSFSSSVQASVAVTNCWAFTNIAGSQNLFNYSSPLPIMSGIVAVSATGSGINISSINKDTSTISNLIAHSNVNGGVTISLHSNLSTPPIISNITSWRNAARNIAITSCFNIVIDTMSTFGTNGPNIEFLTGSSVDVQLKNIVCNGGVTPTAVNGVRISIGVDKISFVNSFFGNTTVHGTSDIACNVTRNFIGVNLYNCVLGSTNEVTGISSAVYNSYVGSSRDDGVSGAFRTFTPLGIITKDYVIFDTSNLGLSASTRLTPTSTASKISYDKIVAVPNGRQLKITVGVRRSVLGDGAAHNGALPQLVVKKNYAVGLTADTVLATATVASNGAFEFIIGTTPAATDNGAFTFCVTTDGTTGWINVDSWIVEVI